MTVGCSPRRFLMLAALISLGHFAVARGDNGSSDLLRPQRVALTTQTIEIAPFAGEKPWLGEKSSIALDGKPYMDLDLTPDLEMRPKMSLFPAYTQTYIGGEYYPLSPDKRFICLLCSTDDNYGYAVIVIDLWRRTVAREEMTDHWFFGRIYGLKWVSNTRFVVEGVPDEWVFDVEDPSVSRPLINEYGLAWDEKKDNYCSIYGKEGNNFRGQKIFVSIRDASMFTSGTPCVRSEAVKYNSRFVYPPETRAFPGEWQYPEPGETLQMAPDKNHPGIDFQAVCKTVKEGWVELAQAHVFSKPVFVADTSWAALFEQVYAPRRLDRVVACNLVLIDAHLANEVPPKSGEVRVVKCSLDVLTPKSLQEYDDMTQHLAAKWNADTESVEIWQEGGQKVYEVPVKMTASTDGTMTPNFGEPVFLLKGKEYVPLKSGDGE